MRVIGTPSRPAPERGAYLMNSCDYALLFIGHKMQLAPLFLFFSIVGGLVAYGFIGVFLGPILLAILLTAIHIYEEEYQTTRPIIPKTETGT
jgi:hypothetical protein